MVHPKVNTTPPGRHHPGTPPPPDTVNVRAVRILLECILVNIVEKYCVYYEENAILGKLLYVLASSGPVVTGDL